MGPRGPSAVKMAGWPLSITRFEPQQAFARAARAGAARSVKAEELERARDQLAVEAAAHDDGGVGAAEVERAGEHALVPEAEDFRARAFAEGKRRGAVLGDDFEAPSAADEPEQCPHQAWRHGQNEALAEGEPGAGFGGHCLNSRVGGQPQILRLDVLAQE